MQEENKWNVNEAVNLHIVLEFHANNKSRHPIYKTIGKVFKHTDIYF